MNDHFLAGALLALTVFGANMTPATAQGEAARKSKDVKPPAGQAQAAPAGGATLAAVLVDAEKRAQKRQATVQVRVKGLKLVDPAERRETAAAGEGHLHYRVDDGPVIATTSTKLSFHELASGRRTISVQLAANDHTPLGAAETLGVTIP